MVLDPVVHASDVGHGSWIRDHAATTEFGERSNALQTRRVIVDWSPIDGHPGMAGHIRVRSGHADDQPGVGTDGS